MGFIDDKAVDEALNDAPRKKLVKFVIALANLVIALIIWLMGMEKKDEGRKKKRDEDESARKDADADAENTGFKKQAE
jgi:hypothetical protein